MSTEIEVKSLYDQSLRGEYFISDSTLAETDELKLVEFERVLKEEAFVRNLEVEAERVINGPRPGITIRWRPREEIDNV